MDHIPDRRRLITSLSPTAGKSVYGCELWPRLRTSSLVGRSTSSFTISHASW